MCGIIGIVSNNNVTENILEGLKRLEYRGYDSAGIATINNGKIERVRAKGKIAALETELKNHSLKGCVGIGHTRWATHGIPSENNAHPHQTDKVSVVHNGIIENFRTLRAQLMAKGYNFSTETDTEVIPTLITDMLKQGASPLEATLKSMKMIEGAFAIAVIFTGEHNLLLGAKKGAPLAVGYGEGEMFLGSDSYALNHLSNKISFLEEGDVVSLTTSSSSFYDSNGKEVKREIKTISSNMAAVGKGNYQHFMLKEIYEQPSIIAETLNAYIDIDNSAFKFPVFPFNLTNLPKITIVACGTSYYAGMVARYWFESIAKTPVEIELASEFRYRDICLPEGGLAIFISQSGETADTLAALKYAKEKKQHTLAIVNVAESSMAREADIFLETYAGPEIGVASTKAFTAQLTALACFVLKMAADKKLLTEMELNQYFSDLAMTPGKIATLLNQDQLIKNIAKSLVNVGSILYIGRGTSYPMALEGALKLKELSYIHAEATAAGELKHGIIALIDDNLPIIVIAPNDHWFEKTASNIQEIAARGGKIIMISDKENNNALASICFKNIDIMDSGKLSAPLLYAIPVQLLAYYTAFYKGTDIDQPRNLAKSVTVE